MVVFSTLLWLISSHIASVPRIFECSQYFHLQCGLVHDVRLHLASSSVDSSRFVQRSVQQFVLEMATLPDASSFHFLPIECFTVKCSVRAGQLLYTVVYEGCSRDEGSCGAAGN